MSESIAIVGLACLYPGASSPLELWENALAQRRAFRKLPAERLRAEDYFDRDPNAPDKTYSAEAAVLEGYEFNRTDFRVVGSTYRSADLAHWLALDMASRALADAGFANGANLPKEATGVILGNTLTGEFSRANLMRLRWPYVRRVLSSALLEDGWKKEDLAEFLEKFEVTYKSPFPEVGEETLAGGLSNTIAGRICNHFDLKGGGYTVDGACASSLLAVANACSSLSTGDLDVALAGGVDLSLDPFELVGFAKTGALAPELMRIYDARSAGFWPGEGCGFVVLMRHQDAIAEGRRIYAAVRGWGVSSDGAGGITRPEVDGQIQALRRAYKRANYGIDTVEYFEGHGTGTAVGDATELDVLSRARRESRSDAGPAAIGSIKGNIGHTKAAAGIAGFIKATFALYTQLLPPTTGCDTPHRLLSGESPALRILREPQPWPANRPLRASVSSMGFGGINAHVTLESAQTERRRSLNAREKLFANSQQDCEIFLFSGTTRSEVDQQLEKIGAFAARLSRYEVTDLAAALAKQINRGTARAAIIASSPTELSERIEKLRSGLAAGADTNLSDSILFAEADSPPKIGFLFPGQGSPANLDGGIYRRRFGAVRELYDSNNFPPQSDGIATEIAQPAIVTASLAALGVLRRLGIEAATGVGHSLGEITALHWAGVFDHEALLRIAQTRGHAMARLGSPTGAMTAIAASAGEVRAILNGDHVSIVGVNSPRQTVISGDATRVAAVAARAQSAGYRAVSLPVSHAFHTELVAAAVPALAECVATEHFRTPARRVVSTVTGRAVADDCDVRELLCRQVTSPVLFLDAVSEAAHDLDLFIEVGPGRVLSGLVTDILPTPAIAVDACGSSLRGLFQAVGAAFVLGAPLSATALFEDRFTRPFNLDWKPKFLVNPCELAPADQSATEKIARKVTTTKADGPTEVHQPREAQNALELMRQLVAQKTELPINAITDESRFLSDLHLNSISVGQLVGEAARTLGLPPLVDVTRFANASVAKAAEALDELVKSGGTRSIVEQKKTPAGVDSWIRAFQIQWIPTSLSTNRSRPRNVRANSWRLICLADHPLSAILTERLKSVAGHGVVVCLPDKYNEDFDRLLLQGARAALELDSTTHLVLVQSEATASGFGKTFHLEHPEITVCAIQIPPTGNSVDSIVEEIAGASGFVEVRYNGDGERFVPRLLLAPLPEPASQHFLTPNDVVLVTGGAKGIGAECALALSRATGARLVLIGRARPEEDAELANNLNRLRAAGIHFTYSPVDITDSAVVAEAIRDAERRAGKITAFIHAAGRNIPKLIESLTAEDLRQTAAPKIEGAQNVLAAIDPDQLRLFVTFGSIIARSGLVGEADYALANERLTQLTKIFQQDHPNCRCLAMEWSVWSAVGMGQRLGRVESLLQQGITPITPETGVEIFLRLLDQAAPAASLVITGRFGEPPTLQFDLPELPFKRFLEKARAHYPGVELIADSTLSADSDPYIVEHAYHGELLFPAVMGLEAMAQVAMALAKTDQPPRFERVELTRPVVIPRNGQSIVRIAALARNAREIDLCLRSEQTGFDIDHFRATCCFPSLADRFQSLQSDKDFAISDFAPAVALDPTRDIYDRLLFHTGRFRRIKNYRLLRARECVVQLEPDAETPWFSRYLPQDRVLGDSGVRDAAIHAIQACIPHARLLPVSVGKIVLGKLPCLFERMREMPSKPELLLHAWQTRRDGDTFHYNLELLGEDGSILEQWINLCLREVEALPTQDPWPLALVGPYLERRFEEVIPASSVSAAVVLNETSESAIRHVLGPFAELQHRIDGKPEIARNHAISISHSKGLTLAVASETHVGCDLEMISQRSKEQWRDLLGLHFTLAETIAIESKQAFDMAATSVWTALEAVKKAGLQASGSISFEKITNDRWLLLRAGNAMIACHALKIQKFEPEFTISILVANVAKRAAI